MSLRTTSPHPARPSVSDLPESPARHSTSTAAHERLGAGEATPRRASTVSAVFGLGGAFWLVLSIAGPIQAGPALFWTWLALGAFLPCAAMLTALVTGPRTRRDMRIRRFLAMSIIGGMLALGLTLGAKSILTTAWPQLSRGWGWLVTDVLVDQTALVVTTLVFLGLLTGRRVTVRRAMLVGGGIGAVFSSVELFRELMAATMAGEHTAAMSVHILQHALLLPIDHPLWTSLLVGVIVCSRRVNTLQASHRRLGVLLAVPIGQAVTSIVTEVVPAMAPSLQIVCLAVAISIGFALFTTWRGVIRHSADEENAPSDHLMLHLRPQAHSAH